MNHYILALMVNYKESRGQALDLQSLSSDIRNN